MNQQGAMPATRSSSWGRRLLPGAALAPGLLLGLFSVLVSVLFAGPAYGQAPAGTNPVGMNQEYFVRQQPDQAMLVRISGVEAEFESRVFTIDRELVIASGTVGTRLAPVFQYIASTREERQLDLRVSAPLVTNRTRFDVGFNRVTIRDDRSQRLAQAYQWLSFGLELPTDDSPAGWSVKVNALNQAARTFQGFGMDELRLWSQFYTAQLSFRELGDNNSALVQVQNLLRDSNLRRYDEIRLATLQLQAQLLAAVRAAGELPAASGEQDPVQAASDAAARQAATLGQQFERAQALYLGGRDLADRRLFPDALARYQAALQVADAIEAGDLATAIRESMLEIHGNQGDMAASSEVLQAIESQLVEEGASDELAQNLLAQGQLYNRTYRYPDALQTLREALGFEHNSATRAQLRLELAHASFELGQLDEAYRQAREAVVSPGSGGYRRPTAVLDVGAGIGLLAGVLRARGELAALREAREAQRSYLRDELARARWAWERALDDLVGPGQASGAVAPLRQVVSGPAELGAVRELAQLWLCRLGRDCDDAAARAAYERAWQSAEPRHAVTAGWLWASIQAQSGNRRGARETLNQVVWEMTFLRYALPGVLGATYWQGLPVVSRDFLEQLAAQQQPERLLLGLAQLRWLAASGEGLSLPFEPSVEGLDDDVRGRLAAVPRQAGDAGARSTLVQELEAGRRALRARMAFLEPTPFRAWLAELGPDEAVLDFHVAGPRTLALLAGSGGVRQFDLGSAQAAGAWDELARQAAIVEAGAFDQLMARWGDRLLGPVVERLPETVYVPANAALDGVPLGALRTGRARFGDQHRVLRLANFPAGAAPAGQLGPVRTDRVFLAGAPEDFSAGFLATLEPGQELRAVMNPYVGPGLAVIQGTALQADEFITEAFSTAGLLHLAMPAEVDPVRPGGSQLELSEPRRGEGRVVLKPRDMRAWRSQADLAVLSQRERRGGAPALTGSGRPALVTELLGAGARAVLASHWSAPDAASARFFAVFHEQLAAGRDPVAAQRAARNAQGDGGASRDAERFDIWLE